MKRGRSRRAERLQFPLKDVLIMRSRIDAVANRDDIAILRSLLGRILTDRAPKASFFGGFSPRRGASWRHDRSVGRAWKGQLGKRKKRLEVAKWGFAEALIWKMRGFTAPIF